MLSYNNLKTEIKNIKLCRSSSHLSNDIRCQVAGKQIYPISRRIFEFLKKFLHNLLLNIIIDRKTPKTIQFTFVLKIFKKKLVLPK